MGIKDVKEDELVGFGDWFNLGVRIEKMKKELEKNFLIVINMDN